jgi:hypothetical protein
MMTEKELISKIRQLRQIEPRKNWVILTKRRILGEPPSLGGLILDTFKVFPRLILQYKLAFITLVLIGILAGTFGFAQNSLPGDPLFPLKKIAERGRAIFVSKTEEPKVELEFANKRLEELVQIAQKNQVKKLAPAIDEFQASISTAVEKLAKIKEPEKTSKIGKAVIEEIKKLKENKKKVESLGVEVGDTEEQLESAMCELAEREIENLGTLTVEQEKLLKEAQEYLAKGECTLAFEKILFLSYQP